MNKFVLLLALFASFAAQAAGTTIALQRVVNDVTTSNYDNQKGTAGAAWVYDAYARAGERIEDSTTGTDYSSTSMECGQSAEIDLSGNTSTTVYNGPAILCGYTLSVTVGTAAVTIDDNVTAKKTLPVSWPIGYYGPMGSIFETSLVVNPADTSTGTLQIEYRPLDADTTWAP